MMSSPSGPRPQHQAVRLTAHADVVAAATDPCSFSSATSRHLHVPNTMDGQEHAVFRAIVDSYMTDAKVADLEPMFGQVAENIVANLPRNRPVDAMGDLGAPFAVRAQCLWLGWPLDLEDELLGWMADNHAATRAQIPQQNAEVAAAFDAIVRRQVEAREAARAADPGREPQDVTEQLLLEQVHDRPLSTPEIVSMLRNWTAGDLSSLSQCVGVVVRRLADEPRLQARVRALVAGLDAYSTHRAELDAIIDECLRIEDPFVSNRRVATCPVTLPSGTTVQADTPIVLDWAQANRDPAVFGNPDEFNPEGNRARNVVYGAGPHVCPGRGLSTAELRAVIVALMRGTNNLLPDPKSRPVPEELPLAGWSSVPVVLV